MLYSFHNYATFFLAVLAAAAKLLAVGLPLAPLGFITSLDPALILFFLAFILAYRLKITSYYYHFDLFAQYAAEVLPLAIFLACRALNDLRLAFIASDSPALGLPAVLAPFSPKRIIRSLPSSLIKTTCDFLPFALALGLL